MVIRKPLVTIVVPSRDRPALVRRAVGCALAQVGVEVEVLVVDDGSQVPLADALGETVARSGGRLRVLRNETSGGVAAARNCGIDEAAAAWVGFCDDDDMWAPSKVRDQLAAPAVDDAVWTCSGGVAVDSALRPLYAMRAPTDLEGFGQSLLKQNLVPAGGSSVIARTAVLRELGGFDPAFSTLADWEMWIRLQEAGPIAGVDRPLVGYLIHPQGMSTDVELLRTDMVRLRAKFRAVYERPEHAVGQHMWRSYLGYRHLAAGQRLRAAGTFVGAAWAGRRALQVAGAAAAVVTPGWVLRRRAAHVHAEIPPDWLAEVQAWLEPLDVI